MIRTLQIVSTKGLFVRKLFATGIVSLALSGAALGADLPRVESPAIPAQPMLDYSWTGFRAGMHFGYGWSTNDWTLLRNAGFAAGNPSGQIGSVVTAHDADGVLGGLQLGYDYQFSSLVLGAGADFAWTGMKGSSNWLGGPAGTNFRDARTSFNWLGTLTGRIGFAFDRTLLYVKGGGAWANVEYNHTGGGNAPRYLSGSATRAGWLVGAGVEHAWQNNWSMKIEYNYIDFGSKRVALTDDTRSAIFGIETKAHTVKLGLNYRFDIN